MYHDVTDIKKVEAPEELSNVTFLRHLMLGTWETTRRNERVHALYENYAECRSNGTRYRGDSNVHNYVAMKYLSNLKNKTTMNLKRFMIRSIFALYPGLSRKKRIWAIMIGITNDRRDAQEIEFVNKRTSHRRRKTLL